MDLATWALFFLLPVAFLFPAFLADKTPLPLDIVRTQFAPWNSVPHPDPHNPTLSDVATQFAPWAKAVRMAWKEGSLPFWDRWNGCGMPLAANGQSQAFSPFTFLMFALPLSRAFALLGAAKLFLALVGMWLWLRELRVANGCARFGAVLFAFSFAITPWLYHPASAEVCLWPWAFFGIELLSDPAVSRRGFLALTFVLAAWPLCGHLETAALGALFGASWLGLRALAGDTGKPRPLLGRLSLASLLALGLSAFALLPQIQAAQASNRLALAKDPAHLDFVPWMPYRPGWLGGFVTSLFPRAFGDMIESPIIPDAAGSIVEMGFGYFGVLGWSGALLVLRPGSLHRAKRWSLLALLLFGLGGAMGLPVFRTIVETLPGIRLLPPLRILLFVSTAGAALAALEMDRLLEDHSSGRAAARFLAVTSLAVTVLAVLVFARLRGRHAALGGGRSQVSALVWAVALLLLASAAAFLLGRRILPASVFVLALTGLAATELLHQGRRLYRFFSPADLYPETPLIRFLHERKGAYRIVGVGGALFPNTNVFAGVESAETHDPAERRDYVQFLDRAAGYPAFDYFKTIRDLDSPTLDFLNVRYLVTPPRRPMPGSKWKLAYDGPDGRIFENSNALPRVFAPNRIDVVAPAAERTAGSGNATEAFGKPLELLIASAAWTDTALVLEGSRVAEAIPGGGNAEVTVKDPVEGPNVMRFTASVSGKPHALVVSSTVNDGGWSASDESGARLPVGLADGPFLAVTVPSGNHVITLSYVPPGFRIGALVSAAALAVLAAMAAGARIRSRPRRG